MVHRDSLARLVGGNRYIRRLVPADLTVLASSTVYVQVPILAIVSGTPYDPTADEVFMAFMPGSAQPTDDSWNAGSWQTTAQGNYIAQVLIGPENEGVVLAPATYSVWVKVVDSPEVPILPCGSLQIT